MTWKRLRIALIILGSLIATSVIAVIGAVIFTFAGLSPIRDGETLGQHATVVKDGTVSLAIIDLGTGGVALVDTGSDSDGDALLTALSQRGLSPDSVTHILLTHAHFDHTAACPLFAGAKVYALPAEIPYVEGQDRVSGPLGHLLPASDNGCRVTRKLRDGELFQLGSLSAEVFAVPGHTPGSAAYLIDGVLYLGDSANSAKDGSLLPAPWIFSTSTKTNQRSLRALASTLGPRSAQIRTLAFSHSGSIQGMDSLLRWKGH